VPPGRSPFLVERIAGDPPRCGSVRKVCKCGLLRWKFSDPCIAPAEPRQIHCATGLVAPARAFQARIAEFFFGQSGREGVIGARWPFAIAGAGVRRSRLAGETTVAIAVAIAGDLPVPG